MLLPFPRGENALLQSIERQGHRTLFRVRQNLGADQLHSWRRRTLTFVEACQHLGNMYGIKWDEKEPTPEELAARFEREQLFRANDFAAEFFRDQYKLSEAAQKYAQGRWSDAIIEEWGIGYAPHKNALLRHAKDKKANIDDLIKAGLIKVSGEDGHYYDAFIGRLMFPIRNRTGNLVGFSGRIINPKKNAEGKEPPKYINTSETPIFKKGETLFGYFEAQRIAARRDLLNIGRRPARRDPAGEHRPAEHRGPDGHSANIETNQPREKNCFESRADRRQRSGRANGHSRPRRAAGGGRTECPRHGHYPTVNPKTPTNISNTKGTPTTKPWPRARPTSWTSCTKAKCRAPYPRTTGSTQ